MKSPAEFVIEKCGGHAVVAEVLGVDISRVYRFTYPKSRGGTDGVIPAKHQITLLAEMPKRGVALRAQDFFATADAEAAS